MSTQSATPRVTGDPYQVHDYDCRPVGPCPEIRLTNGAVVGVCLLPADLAAAAERAGDKSGGEVDQLAAFRETIELAEERGMPDDRGSDLGLDHLRGMLAAVEAAAVTFSPAKLGRWLGWVQCAVVAAGAGTLEEMKAINERHKGAR